MAKYVNVTIEGKLGTGRVYKDGDLKKDLVVGKMYPMRKNDAEYWMSMKWATIGDNTDRYKRIAEIREEADRVKAEQKALVLDKEAKRLKELSLQAVRESKGRNKIVKATGRKAAVKTTRRRAKK